jgi:hypothetical protein
VLTLIATACVEERAKSIARLPCRRNDPRAIEERVADEELTAPLHVEICGRLRERIAIHFVNGRRAAGVRSKKLGGVDAGAGGEQTKSRDDCDSEAAKALRPFDLLRAGETQGERLEPRSLIALWPKPKA